MLTYHNDLSIIRYVLDLLIIINKTIVSCYRDMLYECIQDKKNSFCFAVKFLLPCRKRCHAWRIILKFERGPWAIIRALYRAQYPKWAISSSPVSSLCYSVCNEIEALETPGREIAVPEREWIIGECFSIRSWFDFSLPPTVAAPFTLLFFCLSHRTRFLLPPKISGMIQPDPRINHLSSKLDNGFVPSFIAYQPNSLNIYRAHLQSSLRDIDKRAWIYCHSLDMYEACKKSRGSDFKNMIFCFYSIILIISIESFEFEIKCNRI